jgi:hypothetical protein
LGLAVGSIMGTFVSILSASLGTFVSIIAQPVFGWCWCGCRRVRQRRRVFVLPHTEMLAFGRVHNAGWQCCEPGSTAGLSLKQDHAVCVAGAVLVLTP